MARFTPYLALVAALAVGVAVSLLSSGGRVVEEAPVTVASSTLAVVVPVTLPSLSLPTIQEAASSTSSLAITPPKPAAKPKAAPPSPTPATPPAAIPAPTQEEFEMSANALRSALVNIICYAPAGSGLHSISASGVIIDPKGYILTNAHVAQYFLFGDRGVDCTIRSGSPAADAYEADLAYVSAGWITTNAGLLSEAAPSGTGERDFAILAIDASASDAPLPPTFPYIPLAPAPPSTPGVVIASYGAQFLQTAQIESALFPTVVDGSIKQVYTFSTNSVDVLALGGSAAAQEGSSGGGVADPYGNLIGIITTSTVSGDTSTRSLNAITTSYIRADYASETGSPLGLLLAEPPAAAVVDFAPHIPALEAIVLPPSQ